jgi:predicted nucleic acid-binding protein
MKAVLADTGPLYALADPSDQFHDRAQSEIQSIEERGLQVTAGYPTLCEAHTLVLRRLGGGYARKWLAEMLEGAVLLNPEPSDYSIAADRLDRFPDRRITLVDAVTAVMADKLGMPVWSFDRHFAAMRVKLWRPNA